MNTVKTKLISTKNHLVRNRGKYGVAVGFIAGFYTAASLANEDAFVDSELADTFVAPSE